MNKTQSKHNSIEKPTRQGKPLTRRHPSTKDVAPNDNSLDAYVESTTLIKGNDKRVFLKLLKLQDNDKSQQVKVTHMGLGRQLDLDRRTIATSLRKLLKKGFLIRQKDVLDAGCNYEKKAFSFPETFPGFKAQVVAA